MKKFIAFLLFISLCLACCLFGCKKDGGEDTTNEYPEKPDLWSMDLKQYITLGEYKGISFKLDEGASKSETVWLTVVENSTVISYPEELIDYYLAQFEAQYRYYSQKSGVNYEEILADYGLTEESLIKEAESYAKDDLVYAAIVKVEGIEITEADKAAHFDRFVDQYVAVYGYTKDYVKENLSEIVYDSMLHDKMIEFLILNNQFS